MIKLYFEKFNDMLTKNNIKSVEIFRVEDNGYDEIRVKYNNGKVITGAIGQIEDIVDIENNIKIIIKSEKEGDIPEVRLKFLGIDKEGNINLLEESIK